MLYPYLVQLYHNLVQRARSLGQEGRFFQPSPCPLPAGEGTIGNRGVQIYFWINRCWVTRKIFLPTESLLPAKAAITSPVLSRVSTLVLSALTASGPLTTTKSQLFCSSFCKARMCASLVSNAKATIHCLSFTEAKLATTFAVSTSCILSVTQLLRILCFSALTGR